MGNKMIGSDYLLLLLYLNDKTPIRGAVRLTKMMFIFKAQIVDVLAKKGLESDKDKMPHFIAYNYGPFSKDIYEQIELFSGIGFAKKRDLNSQEELNGVDDMIEAEFVDECYENDFEFKSENNYWEYSIDCKGIGFVEEQLLPMLTEEQIDILGAFKKKITEMPIKQLLYYVYTAYPKYTENSLIKSEVLKDGR